MIEKFLFYEHKGQFKPDALSQTAVIYISFKTWRSSETIL